MTFTLIPANKIRFHDFVTTLNLAYADYFVPFQIDRDAMYRLIRRDAIDMSSSRVVIDEATNKVVGLGLLAIEEGVGWIGGMGIIPAYRRRGLARRIMYDLLTEARDKGLSYVYLEVIDRNTPAYNLYHALGFRTKRHLLSLERQPALSVLGQASIEEYPVKQLLAHYGALRTSENPWQRRFTALQALSDTISGWGVQHEGELVAYALGWMLPTLTRLIDVGMHSQHASAMQDLLSYIHDANRENVINIINLPAEDPICEIMRGLGYQQTLLQYEMYLDL